MLIYQECSNDNLSKIDYEASVDTLATKSDIDGLATKDDFQNLKEFIDERLADLQDLDTIEYPGFSIIMGLVIKENLSTQRGFIYDSGNSRYEDRVSIYLNQKNELIFRVIDLLGEQYTVPIQQNKGGFELDRPLLLSFEYGEDAENSFIRVIANAKEVGRTKVGKTLELSIANFVLGADQNWKRCTNILLGMTAYSLITFTPESLHNLQTGFDKFVTSINRPYKAVGCTNILRSLSNGDLVSVWDDNQIVPNLKK